MKSLIKFVILVLIVLGIGAAVWFAVDRSLFADAEQQIPPQEETGIPAITPQASVEAPAAMSDQEAFQSTSESTVDATVETISCGPASEAIGRVYDMHTQGQSSEAVGQYLAGLDQLNPLEYDIVSQAAESITTSPADQLLPRTQLIEEFKSFCEAQSASLAN